LIQINYLALKSAQKFSTKKSQHFNLFKFSNLTVQAYTKKLASNNHQTEQADAYSAFQSLLATFLTHVNAGVLTQRSH
jgi:hypothetical protein